MVFIDTSFGIKSAECPPAPSINFAVKFATAQTKKKFKKKFQQKNVFDPL